MINNRFIHFETQAQYQANKNNISSNAIVFVDEGRKIYTHGEDYGGVTDYDWNLILARINSIEDALNDIVIPDVPEDILTGVQVVDPKNGQILVYNIDAHKWVNADGNFVTLDTPQTISGEKTFENGIKISDQDLGNAQIVWDVDGTDGLLIDTNGQSLYTDSNFTTNKTIIVKLNANITQDATARSFVKNGTDWMYKGGTKKDYVLLADGSVIALSDIIHSDPEPEPVSYYNVSVFCTTGGLIDGSSSKVYQVLSGGSQTLVFQVQRGYTLSSVTINGASVTPQTTITLNNVTENTTVRATFTQDQPQPSADTVYYGFAGESISDVTTLSGSASNKQDPKGLYLSTSTSNGQYWWIAFPASWSLDGLEFTRNGFKFPMNISSPYAIDGYKAYRSVNTYDANSSIKVKLNEAEE